MDFLDFFEHTARKIFWNGLILKYFYLVDPIVFFTFVIFWCGLVVTLTVFLYSSQLFCYCVPPNMNSLRIVCILERTGWRRRITCECVLLTSSWLWVLWSLWRLCILWHAVMNLCNWFSSTYHIEFSWKRGRNSHRPHPLFKNNYKVLFWVILV